MSPTNLYLSFDGVSGALGYSQVVRVVEGLAQRGLSYLLVSLERSQDLAQVERRRDLHERLARWGVDWVTIPYDASSTARAAATNLARAAWTVNRLCRRRRIARVHARGYHSALVARSIKSTARVPYLFDARGYWIDERAAEGRWFRRPTAYRVAKALERQLYAGAQAVVTLTELQEHDLRQGALGVRCPQVVTIPTCADFDQFQLRPPPGAAPVDGELRRRLEGRRVVALVGLMNASYYVEESFRLCRHLTDLAPDIAVLVVTEQETEARALLDRHGIPPDRAAVARAHHEDMPRWLGLVHWGILLLRQSFAKRGSMPTKLAEFFATGVRPLHHGCNEEVADWVRRVGTGLVLTSVADPELRRAARYTAEAAEDPALLAAGRQRALAHFSLRSGLDRYDRLLRSLD